MDKTPLQFCNRASNLSNHNNVFIKTHISTNQSIELETLDHSRGCIKVIQRWKLSVGGVPPQLTDMCMGSIGEVFYQGFPVGGGGVRREGGNVGVIRCVVTNHPHQRCDDI